MNNSKITYSYLVKKILSRFPLSYQEEWDESGLRKFGSLDKPINAIVVCLDPTIDVINLAVKQKAHLIISHHPIFINNPDIPLSGIYQNKLKLLKKHKISLLSLHTCVDNHPLGLNHYLITKLPVKNVKQEKNTNGSYFTANLNAPTKYQILIDQINQIYQTNQIIYCKNLTNSLIKKIHLCSGSGFSVLKINKAKSLVNDLLITGDIKWHDWVYIKEAKLNVIDVGHDLEKYFINMMSEIIHHQFSDINIIQAFPTLLLTAKTAL